MFKRAKLSMTVAVATTAALLVAGCAGGEKADSNFEPAAGFFSKSGAPEVQSMTAPLFSASSFALPAWIAQDRGFWKAYGLKVETPLVASTQVIPLFLSGATNFAALGGYTALPIQATGRPVSVYGWFLGRHSYGMFAKDGIDSVADLKGKTIGISQPGGLPHLAALAVLRENGIKADEVTFRPLGNIGNIYSTLSTGQVDAGAFGTPYSIQAAGAGLKQIADLKKQNLAAPGVAYVGNPDWVAKNANSAKAYLQGWLEAETVILTDPVYAQKILAANLNLDPVKDAATISAGYEELISVITPPGSGIGETSSELAASMVEAMDLSGQKVKGTVEDLKPKKNLIKELSDDGFFEYLNKKYGTN